MKVDPSRFVKKIFLESPYTPNKILRCSRQQERANEPRKPASENVSGRVWGEIFKSLGKAVFTNPEGSHFYQSGGGASLPIRRGPIFANHDGFYFANLKKVSCLPIRRVLNLSIRRGPIFANPEGSYFCQSGRVLFCQSGGV